MMNIPPKILTLLKTKSSFLAHIHLSPDPDTIGSTLALKLALEQEGKLTHVFCEDPLIENSRFLSEIDSIELTSMNNALTRPHEVYLCLDTAKWPLATHNPKNSVATPVIVVDHHPDNTVRSTYKWVNPEASSTAQMVFELLTELKWQISPEIASCLLFGLLGDTGLFQNNNTKPSDFALAEKLVNLGGDYQQVVLNLARSFTSADLECMGKALSTIKISESGRFSWMALDYKSCPNGEPKTSLIANLFAGRVSGTNFGAILIEKEKGVTKGSLRSRLSEYDVSAIAHHLGGGGHKNAASFKLELPLHKAEKKFLEAVEYIENKK